MAIIQVKEAKKVWQKIAKYTSPHDFSFELEIHKKLLNIFHVGDFYYYIFNCSNAQMELVSDSMTKVLGYHNDFFTVGNMMNSIHPEDLTYFLEFESRVTEFFTTLPPEKVMKYKVSYDYRMKRADGRYIRVLHQAATIQSNEDGAVLRVLGIHTNISRLKKDNGSSLSFIGLEGEPNYENVMEGFTTTSKKNILLTIREKEVLRYLLEGKTTPQIAGLLFISPMTVSTHRKNILRKTDTNSTRELTVRAIQENWYHPMI